MLDDLLGRSKLKARIEELEEERDGLAGQLEGERDRRREAVRDRQDADERVNRLEDKIAELEDRVERLQGDERDLEFRRVETVRGGRLEAILDRLASVRTDEGAFTAMIGDGTEIPDPIREILGDRTALVSRATPGIVCADDAGLTCAVLVPPIRPKPFFACEDAFRLEREWFLPTGEFSFALVRSDLFALGEFREGELEFVTGFESDVKGAHSKGGFSQARFERRRDAQIETHLDRCRKEFSERGPERLIVVGQRTVVSEFTDVAERTAPSDATGSPRDSLEEAFYRFFTTRLYLP